MAKKAAPQSAKTQKQDKPALKDEHRLFILEYMKDLNATMAYLRVYKDSSYDAARSSAADLLARPNIRDEVNRLKSERAEALKVSADEVLSDLRELRDMCMGRKKVKRTLIVKNTEGDQQPVEIESTFLDPHGAKGALELMGKHIAMFTDKHKIEDEVTVILKDFTGKKKSG